MNDERIVPMTASVAVCSGKMCKVFPIFLDRIMEKCCDDQISKAGVVHFERKEVFRRFQHMLNVRRPISAPRSFVHCLSETHGVADALALL